MKRIERKGLGRWKQTLDSLSSILPDLRCHLEEVVLADGHSLLSTLAHTLEPRSPTTLLLLRLHCRCRLLLSGCTCIYRHLCRCRSVFRLYWRGLCRAVLSLERVTHSSFKSLKVFKSELFSLKLWKKETTHCSGDASHIFTKWHKTTSDNQYVQ